MTEIEKLVEFLSDLSHTHGHMKGENPCVIIDCELTEARELAGRVAASHDEECFALGKEIATLRARVEELEAEIKQDNPALCYHCRKGMHWACPGGFCECQIGDHPVAPSTDEGSG